jgi:hypothetical protein
MRQSPTLILTRGRMWTWLWDARLGCWIPILSTIDTQRMMNREDAGCRVRALYRYEMDERFKVVIVRRKARLSTARPHRLFGIIVESWQHCWKLRSYEPDSLLLETYKHLYFIFGIAMNFLTDSLYSCFHCTFLADVIPFKLNETIHIGMRSFLLLKQVFPYAWNCACGAMGIPRREKRRTKNRKEKLLRGLGL